MLRHAREPLGLHLGLALGRVGREIDLRPGVNRLLVVVARAGRAPGIETLAGALALAPEAQGDGWAAWRIEVEVGEVD